MADKLLPIFATPLYRRDINAISDHFLVVNPDAGARIITKIVWVTKLLAEFPDLGERYPRFGNKVRRTRSGKYLIFYERWTDRIRLMRVIHGSRNLDDLELE